MTGASGGIGAATAKLFAQSGTNVVIGDINPNGQKVAQKIKDAGGKAIFVKTDVADSTSAKNLINQAKEGIRINTIAPGLIENEMTEGYKDTPEKWAEMTGLNPMNAAGKPIDIANMVLFLCSDASRFTTAAVVSVDGGQAAL